MEERKDTTIYTDADGNLVEVSLITGEVVAKAASLENLAINEVLPLSDKEINRKFKYNTTYANFICMKIAEGMSMKSICDLPGMPPVSTIARWKSENPAFVEWINQAKRMRAELVHDEIWDSRDEEISKEDVPGAKLVFDKKKFLAEVNDPETYGKKREGQGGETIVNITLDTGIRRSEPIILEGEYERRGEEQTSVREDDSASSGTDYSGDTEEGIPNEEA